MGNSASPPPAPNYSASLSPNAVANIGDYSKQPQTGGISAQQALLSRIEPTLERNRQSMLQQLANQGVAQGTEAYRNAMTEMGQNENDLRLQAALQGLNFDFNVKKQEQQDAIDRYNADVAASNVNKAGLYDLAGAALQSKPVQNAIGAIGSKIGSALGIKSAIAPAATAAAAPAAGGLGSLGGEAFTSWLGSAGPISSAAPTLAPIATGAAEAAGAGAGAAGAGAAGAGAGAAGTGASTFGAAGLNLATLGPIAGLFGIGYGLKKIADVNRARGSGTTDPYAGMGFYDTGYGGIATPDLSDPAVQQTLSGIDPQSGIRWTYDRGKKTYYLPDGTTYVEEE